MFQVFPCDLTQDLREGKGGSNQGVPKSVWTNVVGESVHCLWLIRGFAGGFDVGNFIAKELLNSLGFLFCFVFELFSFLS